MQFEFEIIETNGIRLHTAFAGPASGQPVILLHGFPEGWFCWETQIQQLAAAGFRVIAPDQRGYNLSDRPGKVADYQMELLGKDVIGLADALGLKQFHLAGHDFGALVSWHLASVYPERIDRMVIVSGPHPAVFQQYLRRNLSQMFKSWYTAAFQVPLLPEYFARMADWRILINALPDTLSERDRDRFRAAWSQPGAMTGMINWYRALMRYGSGIERVSRIRPPTLIAWGFNDVFLNHEMAGFCARLCLESEQMIFEDAGHWIWHEKADALGKAMIEHFAKVSDRQS